MRRRGSNTLRRRIVGLVLTLTMVGVAGCGGDDDDDAGSDPADAEAADSGDDADSDGDDAESGDSGGASDSGDSADAGGEDFAIPAPDGLVLDALVDAGIQMAGQRQLYYPDDAVDRLVAFYDDWTGQNGEWARSEAAGTFVYQRIDGEARQQISITPGEDPGAQADGPLTFVLLVSS